MYSELHLTGTRQFLRPSIHHPRDDSRIQIDNRSPTPAQLEFGHLSLPAIPHPSALAVLAVFAPIRGGKQIRMPQLHHANCVTRPSGSVIETGRRRASYAIWVARPSRSLIRTGSRRSYTVCS